MGDSTVIITPAEIYSINQQVLNERPFVRDRHLLRSAAARPYIVLFGEEQFPTLVDKAAAMLHSLAYHHLFADGNKRTARLTVERFLMLNKHRIVWTDKEAREIVLQVAKGRYDVTQVAEILADYIIEDLTPDNL